MIKFAETLVEGFQAAFRGIRNSWDSHDKASPEADEKLAKKLILAGPSHRKFLRMIVVWVDIIAPLFWWKQFDTYKVGTVANSESTMHTITDRDFTFADFGWPNYRCDPFDHSERPAPVKIISILNGLRKKWRFAEGSAKEYWWRQIIEILPESYLQKRTVCLNYEVLRTIYHQRAGHKLDEWQQFREWCESLPMSWLITMPESKEPKGFEFIDKENGEVIDVIGARLAVDQTGNWMALRYASYQDIPDNLEVRWK